MKQHVTPKQLAEIDKEKIQKLLDITSTIDRNNYYEFHCKKMTIGKMIEILRNNSPDKLCSVFFTMAHELEDGEIQNVDDICFYLWEAVKTLL